MIRLLAVLLLWLLPSGLAAEEVVAELSQNRVSINANFDGSEILIFGAVKREDRIPEDSNLEVIVTIEGPSEPVAVRRKSRVAGIWVNTSAVDIDAAPSFYALATTSPLGSILSDTEDLRHKISIPRAIRAVGIGENVGELGEFRDALIRIRKNEEKYQRIEGGVNLNSETLFNTSIALPANLIEGDYRTRVFLTRNSQVVDAYETSIDVRKVGLERWIYNLAHDQPLVYGLLSLAIAIAAGWGASAVFRYIRG